MRLRCERVTAGVALEPRCEVYAPREEFDAELADAIAAVQPDWIVCAGYLRMLDDAFVARFRGRLLNIHPSLLPAYRGLQHACARDRRRRAPNTAPACTSSAPNSMPAR